MQSLAGVAERGVDRDAVACAEAVERDGEVVDTNLRHERLPRLSDGDLRIVLRVIYLSDFPQLSAAPCSA
ncbi:hypothetical protein MIAR_16230 [Microbacterium arabinogalactanolyticum]|nr:hypothetical protein MIAR_16230 [Microbacterium arabinogalactanolyticum]